MMAIYFFTTPVFTIFILLMFAHASPQFVQVEKYIRYAMIATGIYLSPVAVWTGIVGFSPLPFALTVIYPNITPLIFLGLTLKTMTEDRASRHFMSRIMIIVSIFFLNFYWMAVLISADMIRYLTLYHLPQILTLSRTMIGTVSWINTLTMGRVINGRILDNISHAIHNFRDLKIHFATDAIILRFIDLYIYVYTDQRMRVEVIEGAPFTLVTSVISSANACTECGVQGTIICVLDCYPVHDHILCTTCCFRRSTIYCPVITESIQEQIQSC